MPGRHLCKPVVRRPDAAASCANPHATGTLVAGISNHNGCHTSRNSCRATRIGNRCGCIAYPGTDELPGLSLRHEGMQGQRLEGIVRSNGLVIADKLLRVGAVVVQLLLWAREEG